MSHNRREFLGLLAKVAGMTAVGGLPGPIRRALAIPANRRTGTLQDVEHIVILTQENRAFDHYFGTLGGVRGFADPFPIPVPDTLGIRGKNVWYQPNATPGAAGPVVTPFRLDTVQHFEYQRVVGLPHSWLDAQNAWDEGRMNRWPLAKHNHSMGYFAEEDLPFQWALANAFTICDAYHCSLQAGTIPNRLFLWSGTNDGLGLGNGPAIYNDYEWFDEDPGGNGGYSWITYTERLEKAGVSWQVYENMDDCFTDNPLAGFRVFRDAWFQRPGYSKALRDRGVTTRDLDELKSDVLADRLPQVSWIVATAEGSEHPGPSCPAQGAEYTARVLDALTANPEVWSKTVLLLNFDENDGFFDHVPPPAPPSYLSWDTSPSRAKLAGASTVPTDGEYHEHLLPYHSGAEEERLLHRPYGLGPRVPLYVISPWSKGGWVNSQVFDHSSILRFVEARFGVSEPNISAWRRAVCGDLLTAFDFSDPDRTPVALPDTLERARRAKALPGQTTPPVPDSPVLPVQQGGIRPSRALPYELHVSSKLRPDSRIELEFASTGRVGAVFHVYDRHRLQEVPRRYTVGASHSLSDLWEPVASGAYDLWVIGPNGFHRHFCGNVAAAAQPSQPNPEVSVGYDPRQNALEISLQNTGGGKAIFQLIANRYYASIPVSYVVPGRGLVRHRWALSNGPWYDFSLRVEGLPSFLRRFAGRMENGMDSFSDPTMGGSAVGNQSPPTSPSFRI